MSIFLSIRKYIGGIILAFVLMFLLPSGIIQCFNLDNSPYVDFIYLGIVITILTAIIIAFGQKKIFAFSFKSFGSTFIIGGAMTAITAFYLITNIYKGINDYGSPKMKSTAILSFLLSLFIGAGIREELITRGLLLTFFKKAFGKSKKSCILAMSLSSVIFGLMHLTNLKGATNATAIYAQIIYAVGIGFFLAALYIRTGNVWGNIILHFLFDLSLMLYPCIFENRDDIDNLIGEWLGSGMIIKSIIIATVAVLVGLFLIRDSKLKPILDAEAE